MFQALLGHNQTALQILDSCEADPKDFEFSVTKAQIYLKLGMP